jgi:L-serine kinase (ADP)
LVSVRFALVPIRDLKTHEEADEDRIKRVVRQIQSTGVIKKAIVVDAKSHIVLDGVHRLTALKMLGCYSAPAWLVDYSDEDIVVLSRDRKSHITKDVVIKAATQGPKLPPKTTRHMLKGSNGALVHISRLESDVSIPLTALMRQSDESHGE